MTNDRSMTWRYGVCGLLLLATMLLYMDRLTLSVLAKRICDDYGFTNEEYGSLDSGLSYAFAAGAFFFGFLVDRLGPRWLYPGVVIAWSCAGLATAHSDAIGAWLIPNADAKSQTYYGFLACRVALGFFESGHWPCALVTTQIILARADRSLGNSILQSGAALGSVVTPLIVLSLKTDEPGGWRPPFTAIGCIGMLWVVPWLWLVRAKSLKPDIVLNREGKAPAEPGSQARQEPRPPDSDPPLKHHASETPAPSAEATPDLWNGDFCRMFAVLVVIVICINLTWQYFRVWLPKYLQETHGYDDQGMAWFTSAYYIATDVGCIGVGLWVKGLISRGWEVHRARLITFTACAGLTLLAVAVAFLPSADVKANGFWSPPSLLLLGLLLLVAMGTLGLYPNYYSFTQELSRKHQGKISGALGTIAWIGSGTMQRLAGKNIDETKSYATGIMIAGVLPLLACAALWLLWPRRSEVAAVSSVPKPASHAVTGIKEIPDQIRKASP